MTVARLHNTDVAAVDGRERGLGDGVLPHPKAKMDSRSECVSLQSCLAVQCDDRPIGKGPVLAEEDPLLVDDPDLVLRDDDGPKKDTQDHLIKDHSQDQNKYPSIFHQQINR